MKKIKMYLTTSLIEQQEVSGYLTPIKVGKLKFGVSQGVFNDRWRVTELETGCAIPDSYADTKEESIKKAQKAIEKINAKRTYVEGLVSAVKSCKKALVFDIN